jgi:hypothetical protein
MPDPRKKIQHLIASLEELRLHVGRKDLASGKQNLFLEILQKRKISYVGQICRPGDFATMNPEFSATYPLDEALLDRISACVPAAQPDFLAGLRPQALLCPICLLFWTAAALWRS